MTQEGYFSKQHSISISFFKNIPSNRTKKSFIYQTFCIILSPGRSILLNILHCVSPDILLHILPKIFHHITYPTTNPVWPSTKCSPWTAIKHSVLHHFLPKIPNLRTMIHFTFSHGSIDNNAQFIIKWLLCCFFMIDIVVAHGWLSICLWSWV